MILVLWACSRPDPVLVQEGRSVEAWREGAAVLESDPLAAAVAFQRAMAASASSPCAAESGKIAERYCVPTSLPCRLSWVGSCVPRNTS